MNNMLRYIVYILLFLLFTITVDQDYHTVETTDLPPQTSCYPATTRPCKKNSGLLFTNRYCRYATNSHIADNPSRIKVQMYSPHF